jgi:thioredoxin-like negative regulator of GroEL
MKTLLASLAMLFATAAFAGGPAKITDLKSALETAQGQGKMLFVQMGREVCSNCQALKGMIAKGEVRLSASKFVYADVNCDDAKTNALFSKQFKVEGSTLPFVVVTAPDGTQLAARTGYGSADDYAGLLRDAQKAAKKLESGKTGKK